MRINKKDIPYIYINAAKPLNNYGKKTIGVGARRIVYDIGNGQVLKVAKSKYGIKSNRKEVILFNSSSSEVRKLLGEIIDYEHKYQWVKMKKYKRDFPPLKEYKRKLYQLRAIFHKNGIIPYEILGNNGKPNYNNLRLKDNGAIVVIDYGNFSNFKKKH